MINKIVYTTQLVLVALLAVFIISNLDKHVDARPSLITTSNIEGSSILYVPEQQLKGSNAIVSEKDVEETRLKVVNTEEELIQELEKNLDIRVIYLHPIVVETLDSDWLREQYVSGRVIVAINTPMSVLGKKLKLKPELEDLKEEYAKGRISVSMYHAIYDSNGNWEFKQEYSDFVSNFKFAWNLINSTVDKALNENEMNIGQETLKIEEQDFENA